jgi:hypothetical protein
MDRAALTLFGNPMNLTACLATGRPACFHHLAEFPASGSRHAPAPASRFLARCFSRPAFAASASARPTGTGRGRDLGPCCSRHGAATPAPATCLWAGSSSSSAAAAATY